MSCVFVGIDVSSGSLSVTIRKGEEVWRGAFENNTGGQTLLCTKLARTRSLVRVCLEATAFYHLDVALRLHAQARVEVMVVNPRAAKDFARARLQRSKTDRVDADVLVEFAWRMPFVPWQPPSAQVLELRAISRYMASLAQARGRERARLSHVRSKVVCAAIEQHIVRLDAQIQELLIAALAEVQSDPQLSRCFHHLVSIRGIGRASAVGILAELASLPSDMSARQWVAHSGLDPKHFESGTSVKRRTRISKVGNSHLRSVLYMPAVVAARFEPRVRAYYEHLLAKGKKPMQANIAIMRKLLHAIHGMLAHDTDFDGERFFASTA